MTAGLIFGRENRVPNRGTLRCFLLGERLHNLEDHALIVDTTQLSWSVEISRFVFD